MKKHYVLTQKMIDKAVKNYKPSDTCATCVIAVCLYTTHKKKAGTFRVALSRAKNLANNKCAILPQAVREIIRLFDTQKYAEIKPIEFDLDWIENDSL